MDFDRLDSILKERGISRRALALAVGINENTIATAFKRRSGLSSENLLKIARYLNVNPYALVDLGEKPERNEGSERNETTMTDTIRNLLQRAIDTHGAQIQIFKAMEEMGELTQALAKLAGNPDAPNPDYNQMVDHVAEEVADVRIMLEQICMIFDIEERAVRWRWHKLQRLKDRLDQMEDKP